VASGTENGLKHSLFLDATHFTVTFLSDNVSWESEF